MNSVDTFFYSQTERLAVVFKSDAEKVQLGFKYIVYATLMYLMSSYTHEEIVYFLDHGNPLTVSEFIAYFPSTLQSVGWILLVAFFEIETYSLDEEASNRTVKLLLLARVIAYSMVIAALYLNFTSLAWSLAVGQDLLEEVSMCEIAELEEYVWYSFNWFNLPVNTENCALMGQGENWYQTDARVFTDQVGMERQIFLSRVDIVEISTWLTIACCFELKTQLLERELSHSILLKLTSYLLVLLYAVLFLIIVYWASIGVYKWAFDEFVWIFGFYLIDLNLDEWEDELNENEAKA